MDDPETDNPFLADGRPTPLSGHNEREVHQGDFVQITKDTFDLPLYALPCTHDEPATARVLPIGSNSEFWNKAQAGLLREGMGVHLAGVHVMEWLPLSPGRFHTPEAASAREEALRYVYSPRNEFLPLGKSEMILGGVGSVRLKSRRVDGRRLHFFTATSTGISHEGIPLLADEDLVTGLLETFARAGGALCDVYGIVRVIPDDISLIINPPDVTQLSGRSWRDRTTLLPRYALEVTRIVVHRTAHRGELLATAAIMYPTTYYRGSADSRAGPRFSLDGYETYCKKSWTFCSFDPFDSMDGLRRAADWLMDYACRYSNGRNGGSDSADPIPIFSNFDEHCTLFPNVIEFPLGDICDGTVNLARLRKYGEFYRFSVNVHATEVVMGDRITQNIHGGTFHGPVAAKMEHCRLTLAQSATVRQKELLEALHREVAALIERLPESKQSDAADNLELLVKSVAAGEPKREWYEVSARGLLEASSFVKEFTGNIAGTIGQLGKLIWPDLTLPVAKAE